MSAQHAIEMNIEPGFPFPSVLLDDEWAEEEKLLTMATALRS